LHTFTGRLPQRQIQIEVEVQEIWAIGCINTAKREKQTQSYEK